MRQPRVTFGVVNCNRLFYLRSCVESLLDCTADYENKELIIVDNASVENGTKEYLDFLEENGARVFRQEKRDPANEFAIGLNTIISSATGDFICPLQGDMQFTMRGKWLNEYINFYWRNIDKVGCMLLDAQRNVTNKSHRYSCPEEREYKFLFDLSRNPIQGAADVIYSRHVLKQIGNWKGKGNLSHEGGEDSETDMLKRTASLIKKDNLNFKCVVPLVPPAAAIYTDARGTMARVRGNSRFGDYWSPKEDNVQYYRIRDFDDHQRFFDRTIPVGIEEIAIPVGFKAPIDQNGNWMKNPIQPENCEPSDVVHLSPRPNEFIVHDYRPDDEYDAKPIITNDAYLNEWLDD